MSNDNEFIASPAVRERLPLWLGIAGPPGSGKTYSALRLASGIREVKGGELIVIDTESRRAAHYAERFKFKHMPFRPPYGGDRYMLAVDAAIKQGAKTIVIDSMSHEHEGEGGHLLSHDQELDALVKRAQSQEWEKRSEWQIREAMKFSAWIKPAARRRRMINHFIAQEGIAFVFCFRAKEKIAMERNGRKTEVKDLGWQPIAGEELVYEMMAMPVLPPRSGGVPDWSLKSAKLNDDHKAFFVEGRQINEDLGRQLAQWAEGLPIGGGKPAQTEQPSGHPSDDSAWSPEGGWPRFSGDSAAADFDAWSRPFLEGAGHDEALAWEARFRPTLGALAKSKDATKRSIATELTALFHDRAPASTDSDFPGDLPSKSAA